MNRAAKLTSTPSLILTGKREETVIFKKRNPGFHGEIRLGVPYRARMYDETGSSWLIAIADVIPKNFQEDTQVLNLSLMSSKCPAEEAWEAIYNLDEVMVELIASNISYPCAKFKAELVSVDKEIQLELIP